MSVQTWLNFRVTEPRKMQLSSVALRWHKLLQRELSDDENHLKMVDIEPDYRIQMTTVPRNYSGNDIKCLESQRSFRLTPLQLPSFENCLALTCGTCSIVLFERPEAFSLSDRKSVERLNLTISLTSRIWEFTLESDVSLQMVKRNRNEEIYNFELPENTLQRKCNRALDLKEIASDKQLSIIAEAVAVSMCTVLDKYINKEVKPEIREEDDSERQHSISSNPLFGAAHKPILRHRGRMMTDAMQSGFSFTTLFPNPPPIRPPQSLPGLRAAERAASLRSHTSEQKNVLEMVTNTFSVPSNRSENNSVDMECAREKLQTMLNALASEQVFSKIDLGSLMKDIVIKTKESE